MTSPLLPPDSVLLMRALGAIHGETRKGVVSEMALCARLNWDLMHVIRVIARGVEIGYIENAEGGGVALTPNGWRWYLRFGKTR